MLPSYSRISTPDKRKFYAPTVVLGSKRFFLKGAKKTATEAIEYARRFDKKWIELHKNSRN